MSPRRQRVGQRIGPFVWVNELGSRGEGDPWAHRKGEPRVFTLLWAVYLMVGALLTIFGVRSASGAGVRQWTYGCQSMLLLVAVGITLLWPVVRLSQVSPARPRRATLIDLAVVLLPVIAVIWPMPLLAGWTWMVSLGLTLVMVGWGVLVGGVIAMSVGGSSAWGRSGAMLFLLVLVGGGPVLSVVVEWLAMPTGVRMPAWWGLVSPLTVSHELTTHPMNQMSRMTAAEWAAGWVPLSAGALLWMWMSRRPDGQP